MCGGIAKSVLVTSSRSGDGWWLAPKAPAINLSMSRAWLSSSLPSCGTTDTAPILNILATEEEEHRATDTAPNLNTLMRQQEPVRGRSVRNSQYYRQVNNYGWTDYQ